MMEEANILISFEAFRIFKNLQILLNKAIP